MTEQNTYSPPPPFTQQEIDDLVSFIETRVEPLRDAAGHSSEEFKALQAVLHLVPYIKGVAQSHLSTGENPYMEFHYLALIARQWEDHPDFHPTWRPGHERH